MAQPLHAIVAGGGISGLTFASLAARLGIKVTVIERMPTCNKATAGGGIGLWEPSVAVLDMIPGISEKLWNCGSMMSFPGYRDSEGRILARAEDEFQKRFPVLCLNRDDLLNALLSSVVDDKLDIPVTLINSVSVIRYRQSTGQVEVELSNSQVIKGDVLIAADGIHSAVRSQLMMEERVPLWQMPSPKFLDYTYFRANVLMDLDDSALNGVRWWDASFEAWGSSNGTPIRFGYVPLKKPELFWFIALPTGPRTVAPQGIPASIVDSKTKDWLVSLIKDWKCPTDQTSKEKLMDYRALIQQSTSILRTDIHKVPNVTKFPWHSSNGRIILLGDSAHATAPNIAQGAGLCIEDCAVLAKLLSEVPSRHVADGLPVAAAKFEALRKPRAATVQAFADLVAFVGHFQFEPFVYIRNLFMRSASFLFPWLQRFIFEYAVSWSLAGTQHRRSFMPPIIQTYPGGAYAPLVLDRNSLLGRILPPLTMSNLSPHVRAFKTSPVGGSGTGIVTVRKGTNVFSRLIGIMAGLPPAMEKLPFIARVDNVTCDLQKWTRVFGVGTPLETSYSTTHSVRVGFLNSCLTEGIGGIFDSIIKFRYNIEHRGSDSALCFKSVGIEVFGWSIPLPSILSLNSEWEEVPSSNGWMFDGKISLPLFGTLMHYFGEFTIAKPRAPVEAAARPPRVIVAGGTGLVGKKLCTELVQNGWDVVVLSRNAEKEFLPGLPRVRLVKWNGKNGDGWSGLLDSETVLINLAGENPGAKRWTVATKQAIVNTRLGAIAAMENAIELSHPVRPRAYLQASAAGIAGDSGNSLIDDSYAVNLSKFAPETPEAPLTDEERSFRSSGTGFRVACCVAIEASASAISAHFGVPCTFLRIGHVVSADGGLLPYMRAAALLGASRFGSGEQLVPWVHEDDVAGAICHIAKTPELFVGAVNIVAENSVPNAEFLKMLSRAMKLPWPPLFPLPSFFLRVVIGDSSCVLLDSERLIPRRLLEDGYKFKQTSVYEALRACAS